MSENIGLDVKTPDTECHDKKCPFHGEVKIRGQVILGEVESASMLHSAVITRDYKRPMRKYERKVSRSSKYHAHVPECISVKPGDMVKIAECRKLAKTISFVVVEKVNQ